MTLLMRSPWPSKVLTAPVLTTLPWSSLSPQDAAAAFIEIYHLFGKTVDEYFAQNEQSKLAHRHTMGHLLIANQQFIGQAYQIEAGLGAINYSVRHPNLALFRKLAIIDHKQSSAQQPERRTHLPEVIADELFYFAFVYQGYPPPGGSPPPPPDLQAWMPSLKNEATVQLSLLCRAIPRLGGRLIYLITQHLPALNPQMVRT